MMASFHTTIPDPEELFVCPYDSVHMVRVKKMPYHLIKCRKNHPNLKMEVCHFNARHTVPSAEMRYHISICPDKHTVERNLLNDRQQDNATWVKGNTDVPTYFPDVVVAEEENWESEIVSRPRIGVPASEFAGVGYHKDMTGLKRSQKRAYYANLNRGDITANIELMESLNIRSGPDGDGDALEKAVGEVSEPPRPAPVTTFAQPAMGRGRGAARLKRPGLVTPGAAAAASNAAPVTPPQEPVDVTKLMKKIRKKLRQIDQLVERQANGEALNEEERVKVALKATLQTQLERIESQSGEKPI